MPTVNVSALPGKLSGILLKAMPEAFFKHEGVLVEAVASEARGYEIDETDGKRIALRYGSLSDLMCALGDIVCDEVPEKGQAQLPRFEFRGVSLDCSRNGSPTVEFLQDALARMALMGLNRFCLYTEDTYEVEGEPLIGFARGRYSKEELKKLSAFAAAIGVEMFPCMQTLGHLEHILKYPDRYGEVSDNPRVINVREPKAYALLEKMIASACEPYESKLIHLGTDEPWGIGRGKSLDFENPVRPGSLYAQHLKAIAEICEKRGLKGIVWGDYVLGHSGEKALSGEDACVMPKSLLMDYWSYCSTKPEEHDANIKAYREMGYEIMVSPGLWNWNRFWGNTPYAIETTKPLMEAAASYGVKKALMTMWGDDGQESLFDSNWASLSYFLASCRIATPSEQFYGKRVERIARIPMERFKLIAEMENPDLDRDGYVNMRVCVGKPLLYDDPLLSFANKLFKDDLPFKHFAAMEEKLRALKSASPRDRKMKRLACAYAKLIALKYRMQRQTRLACLSGKKAAVKKSLRLVADTRKALRKFRMLYSEAWLAERKSFGLEIVEARLGGLEARLDSFSREVRKLAAGEVKSIPEFELENPPEIALHTLQCYCSVSSKNHNALWI